MIIFLVLISSHSNSVNQMNVFFPKRHGYKQAMDCAGAARVLFDMSRTYRADMPQAKTTLKFNFESLLLNGINRNEKCILKLIKFSERE